MNVYDFDGTYYDGDSSIDFVKYIVRTHPRSVWRLFSAAFALGMLLIGIWSKEKFKSAVFSVVRDVNDIDNTVCEFWQKYRGRVGATILGSSHKIDVIISASPTFLLTPIAEEIGATLIASCVDPQSGKWIGKNCHGAEKVLRFQKIFGDAVISQFYSDSLSDAPMATLAQEAWIVRKDRIVSWGDYKPSAFSKLKAIFLNPQFFGFVFCGGIGTLFNVCVSSISALFIDPALSFPIGYGSSLFITYMLSSKIVFRENLSFSRLCRFILSYIPHFCILFAFTVMFIKWFHWNHIFVYLLTSLLGVPLTFVLVKILAYGQKFYNYGE